MFADRAARLRCAEAGSWVHRLALRP